MEQRLIDANALTELLKDERDFYKKMYDCMQQPCEQDERAIIGAYYTAYSKSYHIVKDAPTVDAVKVVRCGECRFYKPWNSDGEYGKCKTGLSVMADMFCSCGSRADGERRSDEQQSKG